MNMHDLLVQWVSYLAPIIEAVGILVVVWGAIEGVYRLLLRAIAFLRRVALEPLEHIRLVIGEKMALGIDFFLAGDIIQTIVVPSMESLAMLGGIVVIRTVLAYFLANDLQKMRAGQ